MKIKKLIVIILALLFVIAIPKDIRAEETIQVGDIVDYDQLQDGDRIVKGLGTYAFGTDPASASVTDIIWRILDADQTSFSTNGMFLTSENVLAEITFGNTDQWSGSNAQKWCNDFYNRLKSKAGRIIIKTNKAEAAETYRTPAGANINFGALEIEEYVFYLSAKEVRQYFANDTDRAAYGANTINNRNYGYFLRTPAGMVSTSYFAGYIEVDKNAHTGTLGKYKTTQERYSRPAMNIDPTKARFRYLGEKMDGETVLYKQYEILPIYKVTFDYNDGERSEKQDVLSGEKATAPLTTPTWSDYEFEGWYTEATGGTAFDCETTAVTADLTLYAHWKKKYTFTINYENGQDPYSYRISEGAKAAEPEDPVREGFIFAGWYTDATAGREYNFDTPVTADAAIYARWKFPYISVSETGEKNLAYAYGAKPVTADMTTWNAGWYVVIGHITIDHEIACVGPVNLILADGASLKITIPETDPNNAGIRVGSQENTSLTIYGQTQETGCLDITTRNGSAIGGRFSEGAGDITICGGTIKAEAGDGNPIGCGRGGSGGTVTLIGGNYGFDVRSAGLIPEGYAVLEEGQNPVTYIVVKCNKTERKEKTCTTDGNVAYWTCVGYDTKYKNAQATEAYTDDSWIIPAGHEISLYRTIAPTCAEQGRKIYYCSECNYGKTESIPALGHEMIPIPAKKRTCNEKGRAACWFCSVCGKMYKDAAGKEAYAEDEWIIPAGHDYTHKTVAAKVGVPGSEYDICTVCGDIINQKTIPALNPAATSITKLTPYSKAFTVKWTKKAYTGYQIRYSLKSSMASAKTVTITKAGTVSKKITKLKAKKKYYVQIRTYKTVGGKKYYSKWSAKKAVKTK